MQEYDAISGEVKKWFKKLAVSSSNASIKSQSTHFTYKFQKEEKAHDDKISNANTKIKQAGKLIFGFDISMAQPDSTVKVRHTKRNPRRTLAMLAKNMHDISTSSALLDQRCLRRNSQYLCCTFIQSFPYQKSCAAIIHCRSLNGRLLLRTV